MDVRSIDTLPQYARMRQMVVLCVCGQSQKPEVWPLSVKALQATDGGAVWTIAEACSLAVVRQSLCMRQMVVLCGRSQ